MTDSVLLACFFCGVDSSALVLFLGLIVGGGVTSLVCFIVWGVATGHLDQETQLARTVLDVDTPPTEEELV